MKKTWEDYKNSQMILDRMDSKNMYTDKQSGVIRVTKYFSHMR